MEKSQIFSLAAKASHGDMEAFELLLQEKSRHILYNAYDILKNHHDAEDAAQEIVVKMYQHIGNLREPENFNAWLHKIIHNVCISKIRKSKYYKNDLDVEAVMDTTFCESLIEKDREFLPHTFAEDESLREALLNTIKELPRRRRRAILLYYYEDLSQREIAQIMNVSESTVASNILRARKDIKEKLEAKTGVDIERDMEYASVKLGGIPVLGQVLSADAATRFGPESIARLTGIDFSKVPSSPSKPANFSSGLGVKIATIVTTAGIICGGAFVAMDGPKDGEATDSVPPTNIEKPIEQPAATLPENGQIVFSGGECDCGHENPNNITLKYDAANVPGELEYAWELVDGAGSVISQGAGRSIDISDTNMVSGIYTAKFILSDKQGNILNVERDFEIK